MLFRARHLTSVAALMAGGPFMLDTFTDTAGTALGSHTGEVGAVWTKASGTGTAIISPSGKLRPNVAASSFWGSSGVPNGADYAATAIIYAASNTGVIGPCIRVNAATNTGYVSFYNGGAWQLYSFVAGVGALLGTYSLAVSAGLYYVLTLRATGTSIELYLDTVPRISVTNSAVAPAGKIGVWADGNLSDSTGVQLCRLTGVDGGAVVATRQIVFDGNSLTVGYLSTDGSAYPIQLMGMVPGNYRNVGNFAVSGQTTTQMSSDAAAQIDALLDAGAYPAGGICVPWEIRNDIVVGGKTATQAYNNYVSYCQARQLAGWKVVAVTVLPCSGGDEPVDFETSRQTINTNIRNNWNTFADALADVGGDGRIGDSGDQNDAAYYNADKLHLSNAGYGVIAALVATAAQSIA